MIIQSDEVKRKSNYIYGFRIRLFMGNINLRQMILPREMQRHLTHVK